MAFIHGSMLRPLLRAAAAAGLLLAVAGNARAGDEFEDGFKDELGRIAAYEAVGVGRTVLAQVLLGGHPGYYGGGSYGPRYHYDHDDRDRHRHRSWDHGHGRRYWGHGPRWHHGGHGYWGGHRGGWGRGHHRHHHRHHHGCGH